MTSAERIKTLDYAIETLRAAINRLSGSIPAMTTNELLQVFHAISLGFTAVREDMLERSTKGLKPVSLESLFAAAPVTRRNIAP